MVSPAQATRESGHLDRQNGSILSRQKLPVRARPVLKTLVKRLIPGLLRHETAIAAPRTGLVPPQAESAMGRTTILQARLSRGQFAALGFLVGVFVPTLIAFVYLSIFAVPQFRSEARLVVRGNLEQVAGGGSPIGGVPQVPNSQEAQVIVDYLRSRTLVGILQQQMDLRRIFASSAHDPLFGLSRTASEDQLVTYWNRQVKVALESTSGVITVKVSAFSPQSAAMLAAAVIRQAEQAANDLTIRNRGDRVVQAGIEERAAFTDLAVVRSELEAFRNTQGTLDPLRSAVQSYSVIARLRDQRSEINTDLNAARMRLDDNSPVVRALKERLRTVDEQIKALDSELLGSSSSDAGSAANLIAGAELEVHRRLAEQRLRQAELELMEARTQEAQKQVYILTFMAPTMPDEKIFPSPLLQASIMFAVLATAWAVISLYIGSIYARTR